jgi:hypothetical protein
MRSPCPCLWLEYPKDGAPSPVTKSSRTKDSKGGKQCESELPTPIVTYEDIKKETCDKRKATFFGNFYCDAAFKCYFYGGESPYGPGGECAICTGYKICLESLGITEFFDTAFYKDGADEDQLVCDWATDYIDCNGRDLVSMWGPYCRAFSTPQ